MHLIPDKNNDKGCVVKGNVARNRNEGKIVALTVECVCDFKGLKGNKTFQGLRQQPHSKEFFLAQPRRQASD